MVTTSWNNPDFTGQSCGKSFEEKSGVQDLSDLATGALLAGSSQAGGNTSTPKNTSLQLAAPGTPSEQTSTNVNGDELDDTNRISDPAAAKGFVRVTGESGNQFPNGHRRGGEPGDPFGSTH